MPGTPCSFTPAIRRAEWPRLVKAAAARREEILIARDRALVAVVLFGGLLASELVTLRVGDLDLERGVVAAPGDRSIRRRTARIGGPGVDLLDAYLDERPEVDPAAPLFLGRGGAISLDTVGRVVSGAGVRAGFGDLRPADLRRAHGVRLAELAFKPAAIAEQMGIGLNAARGYFEIARAHAQLSHVG
jgi:integrase